MTLRLALHAMKKLKSVVVVCELREVRPRNKATLPTRFLRASVGVVSFSNDLRGVTRAIPA